jgi:putative acetyltransferase
MPLDHERPGDEDAIDDVVCRAFGSMCEAHIIRLMRQTHPAFDPAFSLVMRDADRIIGHVLFTPARIRLMGRTIAALAVGPVATTPDRQKQGIAARIMQHGHELGRSRGFALCFLYGHPGYYRRLGYTACYGSSEISIDLDKLPAATVPLQTRPVRPDDVSWLSRMHERELANVDFGWLWGAHVSEWSLAPMNSLVWETRDGKRIAYTVCTPGRAWSGPGKCDLLLAEDPAMAREVLATIRPKSLPHHPSGWLAREALPPDWSEAKATRSDAAMAFELQPGVLREYLQALTKGRPPGCARFPLAFAAC